MRGFRGVGQCDEEVRGIRKVSIPPRSHAEQIDRSKGVVLGNKKDCGFRSSSQFDRTHVFDIPGVCDPVHPGANQLRGGAKTSSQGHAVGFPAMEDEVALPVETIERVGQMGLNIGEHFGGGTEKLLHSQIGSSVAVTPKIQRMPANNGTRDDSRSLSILIACL